MKKILMVLLLLAALGSVISIAAADDGCRVDEYGCWVTDEDGNKMYLMFWSEPARKYIMGDLSEPGTALVDKPADLDIGMAMVSDPAPIEYVFVADPTELPLPTFIPMPTVVPTAVPTALPTVVPTAVPTALPTVVPTDIPTVEPTPVTASCVETASWLYGTFSDMSGYDPEGVIIGQFYEILNAGDGGETACLASVAEMYECTQCIMNAAMANPDKWDTDYSTWEGFAGEGSGVCRGDCAE